MYKLSLQRILIIIGICLVGVFFAIPNIMPNQQNLPKWWQPISLGLDLQGGSSLLLQHTSVGARKFHCSVSTSLHAAVTEY